MMNVSTSKVAKRKMEKSVADVQPPSKSSKACLLAPSLLLEIPADTNTSLPVWDAVRSSQLDLSWTVNPYSISIHLTPTPPKQTASGSSECTSTGTQPSPQSTSVVQPRMVVQQGFTHVLLTFSHNSTQALPSPPDQPQKTPPIPGQAASLVVPLPAIIGQTQPQPAASPSIIKTPQAAIQTTTKFQTPPKAPAPTLFHTRSSSEIKICDDFLVNMCLAGKRCKKHHTPFPYHWQLQCAVNDQWVDIPLKSQPLLERLYSNVKLEEVCIKDGSDHYNLNFESMDLDPLLYKYYAVRRLQNSEKPLNLLRNRYFPTCWKIYWWNNFDWEEYSKDVSTLLLQKMREDKLECSFRIGSQEYSVDFTTMIQTNVITGFHRDVRCRPIYRSPDSMQPHLQTGVQLDPVDPVGDNFNVDPLGEFSSWYPPVWCLTSEQDYSLVDVPARTPAYRNVQNLFYKSLLENVVDIVSIQQIQNRLQWDKYQRHKLHMQKQYTKTKEPLERHLFHGTTKEASEDICHNNFDPRMAGVNGVSCGYGSYFATTAAFSHGYSPKTEPDSIRHMFLAKVLVGKVSLGNAEYRRPPPLSTKTRPYQLYDTCVNNMDKPTMFVVFDSCQCYPYYLIKYRDLPQEICL